MNKYQVLIVGAGTSGLMLARELGKAKIKTLLLERKSDPLSLSFKTLGSFINLKSFDLSENVIAQPISQVTFYSKHFKRILTGEGLILDKYLLHKELLESIDTNYVEIKSGINIKECSLKNDGQILSVIDKDDKHYYSDYFVDASGINGVFSKKFNLLPKNPDLATGVEYNVKYLGNPNEAHLFIGKSFEGGYAWIFPLKNNRAIFGFGTFGSKNLKNLNQQMDSLFSIPKIKKLVEKDNNIKEGGSIPITPVLTNFVHKNILCVGDSVSQVNPVVGEGYKFIFEAAYMAKTALCDAIESDNIELLKEYELNWRKRFSKTYASAKNTQQRVFKYSQKDLLVDFAVLMLKFKKDEKVLKVLSGEYSN
ncbi:MAG: NAD(P)/FAD-dependent oxidoreductase [Flavobacteriia bacterium]|nr:NAD(P)/FAD-dependent oxidoreductase [Flavobacteriia bacterium]